MTKTGQTDNRRLSKTITASLMLGWTTIIIISLTWNLYLLHRNILEKARIEALTLYELNLAYRSWATGYGGVYVPVTEKLRPNPYLKVPRRDVTTKSGNNLTLVNSAWMNRQVFEILGQQSPLPIMSHLTSLQYLNPANKPDAWEEQALRAFEQGSTEAHTTMQIDGNEYQRIMKPFVTEQGCLTCHGYQGYAVGDVRGGISIAVPLKPFFAGEMQERWTIGLTHAVLWCIGLGGILWSTRMFAKQQALLAGSGEKYRLLFENNPHPMWVYDLETLRFLTANDAAKQVYGYSQEEFLSMTIADLRPSEDIPALPGKAATATDGLSAAGIWRHQKKDGSAIVVELASHPVVFADHRATLVMATDITERRQLENQLRQAQKMEAVGQLAGGVAHDFNNILTAISGYGALLLMKLRPDDPVKHHAEQILAASKRAAHLVKSLLTYSRKQIIDPRPVDLNALVSRIALLLRRLIGEDIDLRTDLAHAPLMVMADSVQIDQALMNLSTNARDAMPAGGSLRIDTARTVLGEDLNQLHGVEGRGAYALITITDTGHGMDEATRLRIFDPFFTTKDVGKGTGLGLAMVYGVIKQHNGLITVDSEPGKGSCFRIYLPLLPGDNGSLEEVLAAAAVVPRGTETVLLAEDDDTVRSLTRRMLEEFGYRVIEACDGEDAVQKFNEHADAVSLAILDVVMPKKNGMDAYRELQKLRPGIKALFMSGYTADIIEKRGILDKGMLFISKPASPDDLLRIVRKALDIGPVRPGAA
jgi:PAS domain S-box-containing protein